MYFSKWSKLAHLKADPEPWMIHQSESVLTLCIKTLMELHDVILLGLHDLSSCFHQRQGLVRVGDFIRLLIGVPKFFHKMKLLPEKVKKNFFHESIQILVSLYTQEPRTRKQFHQWLPWTTILASQAHFTSPKSRKPRFLCSGLRIRADGWVIPGPSGTTVVKQDCSPFFTLLRTLSGKEHNISLAYEEKQKEEEYRKQTREIVVPLDEKKKQPRSGYPLPPLNSKEHKIMDEEKQIRGGLRQKLRVVLFLCYFLQIFAISSTLWALFIFSRKVSQHTVHHHLLS